MAEQWGGQGWSRLGYTVAAGHHPDTLQVVATELGGPSGRAESLESSSPGRWVWGLAFDPMALLLCLLSPAQAAPLSLS